MTEANLISLFSFEQALLEQLSGHQVVEIQPGTVLLKEQEYIKVIPLVLEGSIKPRKLDPTGREIVFYHIEPGESCILSITSCLNNKESQAKAIISRLLKQMENEELIALERVR
jgi:CRP/FNR family transcriptional regulator